MASWWSTNILFWQALVNVPLWAFWTSLSSTCWRSYPQYLGDVQLGHLPTPCLMTWRGPGKSLRTTRPHLRWSRRISADFAMALENLGGSGRMLRFPLRGWLYIMYIYIHTSVYTQSHILMIFVAQVLEDLVWCRWVLDGWSTVGGEVPPPKKRSLFQTCFKLQTSKFSIDSIPNLWKPSFVAYESSEWSKSLVNQVVAILEWVKTYDFFAISLGICKLPSMKTSYIRVPSLGTRVLTHNHNGSHGTGGAQWALPVSCGAVGSPGSPGSRDEDLGRREMS